MASNNATSNVVSVDEQAFEQADARAVEEDGFPVVDETPQFEASVESYGYGLRRPLADRGTASARP